AWFRGSDAYEEQRGAGVITCPVCADTSVDKAPMAPRISKGVTKGISGGGGPEPSPEPLTGVPAGPEGNPAFEAYVQGLRQVADAVRRHVEENCDYVGHAFAEEARKIHYGETDARPIYGEASTEESRELEEEGVEFTALPFPVRPDS
ncbi:MAG: DUF1178 family protein, partial [Pontimonas sp.]